MPRVLETTPPEGYAVAVKEQVARDLLQRASREICHPLKARVFLIRDDEVIDDLGNLEEGHGGGSPHEGEVRIRFRETAVPGRLLFHVDSLFRSDPREPSFSGIRARGEVSLVDSEPVASFKTWIVKRFDERWVKWL